MPHVQHVQHAQHAQQVQHLKHVQLQYINFVYLGIYSKDKHWIIICLAVEVATRMIALVVTLVFGRKAYKGTLKQT